MRAHDGGVRVVELVWLTEPDRLWPPEIRSTETVLHPIVGRVLDVTTSFLLDRASFDAERDWQNYDEAE